MKHRYLEVTFRDGRPLAAYLYLLRGVGDVSARTERRGDGLLVDFSADGRPLGIEITSPAAATLAAMNRVLASLNEALLTQEEIAPLAAA
jgi:uncharacterized protein YuzE